uniref:Reverse transcriptase Ty1/copia-type domain-containing protein n=1 Tax=Fagus sylvatica TaxID=28930 RepID=A0A2N9HJJ4_FAGSY
MTGEEGKTLGIEKFDGTDFGCAQCCEGDDHSVLMTALSGMSEKLLSNNKVHLVKKLFNLKMAKCATMAKYLNEFNTITNQLFFVEIEFDDEIRILIVLASLPNNWEAMRMVVNNSAGKGKLKYNNIRDLILSEEVRRRDAGMLRQCRRTHVKACKKKFNVIETIEKTPQLRVKVNNVAPKRVKFSLLDNAIDRGAIWGQAPTLEIVKPHEKRSTRERRKDSSKNIWVSNEGETENWIKDIQGEINSFRVKGIDIDDVFSVLVKMMKKLELRANLADMDSN